jgi:hypothetical protein
MKQYRSTAITETAEQPGRQPNTLFQSVLNPI